ncbi:hypothetical protein BDV93DRAFT_566430 [Ceratobasidium sp. AG-I]|nr:hypothetical protein BDV93DRAFT_566430 [Ceratobasidium sp. AG-I]
MPPHPSGRERCTACVRDKTRCFRKLPACGACVKHGRICIYEVADPRNAGGASPGHRQAEDEAEHAADEPEDEEDELGGSGGSPSIRAAGVRAPRLTPTEWGSYGEPLTPIPSHMASPGPADSLRRTRSLASLLGEHQGRTRNDRVADAQDAESPGDISERAGEP